QMGWFDRDVTKMYQLPPSEEAARLVELIGGRNKVGEAAKVAMAKKKYAWAAELVNSVYRLDPADEDPTTSAARIAASRRAVRDSAFIRSLLRVRPNSAGPSVHLDCALMRRIRQQSVRVS